MRLPAPLLRRNPHSHKNTFGHVLILAGSSRMLGAAAITSLSAMRAGAGLVTLGIPKSLNQVVQKKISNTVMTWPLPQTRDQTLSLDAYPEIQKNILKFQALAIGPGLSQNPSTQKLIRLIIASCPIPLVIDADALNALSKDTRILEKGKGVKVLTPHAGEMARLTGLSKKYIALNRLKVAQSFVRNNPCTLLLKGDRTIVAAKSKKTYINATGNVGLATAGSGDVLTGIIAAFLGQGLLPFEAAKWGAFIHGKAADITAQQKPKVCIISTDLIENLPKAFYNK